jgi:hypothetical protein|tara:strand:- start:333 stop:461 length:129 start_codon:yes stop_codon:yes gene_type:complete
VWSGEAAAAGLAIRVCLKEFEHEDKRVLTKVQADENGIYYGS